MARILVIDDETNIRMMIRLALQHVGHEVDTASDGQEGLEKYSTGIAYDLVLLDQRMPGMEGLEVLRELRRRNLDSKVVMITAYGTVDLAVDAMKAGATDFLRKPFTAETLRGVVKAALRGVLETAHPEEPGDLTYVLTTINGFRLESSASKVIKEDGAVQCNFTVINPDGASTQCSVVLPAYMVELVKAQADSEKLPGGDRFWQALCEEALANFLWQHAEYPPDNILRVDDLSTSLRRWMEVVLFTRR